MRADLKRLKRETESRPGARGSSGSVAAVRESGSDVTQRLPSSAGFPNVQVPAPSSSSASALASVDRPSAGPTQGQSYAKIAGIAAVLVVAAAALFWFVRQRSAPVVVTASQKTVAVLPLQNLGADKDVVFCGLLWPTKSLRRLVTFARLRSARSLPLASTTLPRSTCRKRARRCM